MTAVADYQTKTKRNRMGLWLFLLSDAFVFGGLLVTRFTLLPGQRPDLNQGLGLAVTAGHPAPDRDRLVLGVRPSGCDRLQK